MRQIANIVLVDPVDGGKMVISSAIEVEHNGLMRFTVTNPKTRHRYGVSLGMAELTDSDLSAAAPAAVEGHDAKDAALQTARDCLSTLNAIGEYVRAGKVIETSMRGINAIDAVLNRK